MLRTKKQQQKICSHCPLAKTADLIGDSCTLLIIRDLLVAPKHFGDLETSLAGVSTRTLSHKLKQLEKTLVIKRKEIAGKPVRFVYILTAKGRGLHSIATAMARYGEKYL